MTVYALSDAAYLEQHPRAYLSGLILTCGNGIAQGTWGRCIESGAWWVEIRGSRLEWPYCAKHAAIRLRAADRLGVPRV